MCGRPGAAKQPPAQLSPPVQLFCPPLDSSIHAGGLSFTYGLFLLPSLQVIVDNIVANFASTWQKEGGGKMTLGETATILLSSAKKVFCLQMIVEAAFPVLPFLEELRRPGQDAL